MKRLMTSTRWWTRPSSFIFDVSERRVRRDLVPVRQVMHSVVDRIDYLHRHQGDVMGVPTGFAKLDKLLGGFQKSDLVILAARPAWARPAWH